MIGVISRLFMRRLTPVALGWSFTFSLIPTFALSIRFRLVWDESVRNGFFHGEQCTQHCLPVWGQALVERYARWVSRFRRSSASRVMRSVVMRAHALHDCCCSGAARWLRSWWSHRILPWCRCFGVYEGGVVSGEFCFQGETSVHLSTGFSKRNVIGAASMLIS
jgi:hypothetical protein